VAKTRVILQFQLLVIGYWLLVSISLNKIRAKLIMIMTLEEINAKLDLLLEEIENWKPKSDLFLKEIETWKQPNIKEKGKANV
jgi:hypothetical protein